MNTAQQIQELQAENNLLKLLGSENGFYIFYFQQLKFHRTNIETFNHCNDLYLDLFGEYRYSDYRSFAASKLWKYNKRKVKNKNQKK